MGGGDNAAQRASDVTLRMEQREHRIEERRRKKAERRARRYAEQERRRLEDAQLLGHLIEQRAERGTLETIAAEMPRPLNRGFGFSQPVQVSPTPGSGRFGVADGASKEKAAPPPIVLKRPV